MKEIEPQLSIEKVQTKPELSAINLELEASIEQVLTKRETDALFVKDSIALKLFHEIEKKLAYEQDLMHALIAKSQKQQTRLRLYSNILDQTYFEQKFLTPDQVL